jgi:hypothetical protein
MSLRASMGVNPRLRRFWIVPLGLMLEEGVEEDILTKC